MNARLFFSAALLATAICANAQFIVEHTDGQNDSVKANNVDFKRTGDSWSIGGTDVSQVKTLRMAPLADRLNSYDAPTYPEYYRSISGWNMRGRWNLANVHDPSVMRADDGYYYMYTTDASFGNAHSGHGHFMCRRSRNLVDWEFMGATMPSLPSWVKPKLNEIRSAMGLGESTADFSDDTQFGYWAPCARKVSNGLYRMYYAITCPGTIDGDGTWGERAFIGLMETSNPADVNSWEDKGFVITNASDKGLNYKVKSDDWANCYYKWNAIDPSFIITPEGEHWLIYGSWHSGFAAVQLDPETGKTKQELGNPWGDISAYGKMVNTRKMGNRWQGSEAPEVVWHDGYYYLFMAYDELAVAYNTRVARSKNIDGPYVGIDGTNISTKGGDALPIVTHPYKFSDGYGWVGVSHCAVFDDGQGNWYFSSQGRLPANAYGDAYSNAIMQGQVRRMVWTADGWPVVMPECYGAVPQAQISESDIVGTWENIALSYTYQKQNASSWLKLSADHKVQGYPFGNSTWAFDQTTNTLTIGSTKLQVSRETDWEASPRRATLVYAGLNGKQTYWGKKSGGTTVVGRADNSATFWTAFTPYMYSSGDCEFKMHFTNYTDKAENWDNWTLAITNGKERNASGYTEYAVLRADSYGWGTYCTEAQRTAGMKSDYNWDTFKSDMDGAEVSLSASIKSGTLSVKATTTTTSGKTYNYTYTVSGLPQGAKGAFLSMEKAHLVVDNAQCEVVE